MIALGIDIGGSGVKAGVVSPDGRIWGHTVVHLAEGQAKQTQPILDAAVRAGREAQEKAAGEGKQACAIGIGVPGVVDAKNGVVVASANLEGLRGVALARHVGDALKLEARLANDANAAALGEVLYGGHGELDSLVLFTLGTGIGGGIVINGKIVTGHNGYAGELGHMRIEMSSPRPCGCGRWGCLEAYAGNLSIVKRAHEALADDWKKTSCLHKPAEDPKFSAEQVFGAAKLGDPLATRLVEETALALAVGAVNMVHALNPQRVLFAGGMTAAGSEFLDLILSFARDLPIEGVSVDGRIGFASLGDKAGVVGAAAVGSLL